MQLVVRSDAVWRELSDVGPNGITTVLFPKMWTTEPGWLQIYVLAHSKTSIEGIVLTLDRDYEDEESDDRKSWHIKAGMRVSLLRRDFVDEKGIVVAGCTNSMYSGEGGILKGTLPIAFCNCVGQA
jgi:hypothetical protein